MSRPATAPPSRSRVERAQSSPVGRTEARRMERGEEQRVGIQQANVEEIACRPRRGSEIEELQSGDDIEELTSVHVDGQGNDRWGVGVGRGLVRDFLCCYSTKWLIGSFSNDDGNENIKTQ